MATYRILALLAGFAVVLGCNSPVAEESAPQPERSPQSAAETEYAGTFLSLMLEFKANAEKSNQELDEAEAKGLPTDRKAKRAVLIELMERSDSRGEALLAKAQKVDAPPRFANFHASVTRFLQDYVDGNTRYREAVKKNDPNASKISEDGLQKLIDNYAKIKSEGEKLGIPMADLEI